uniref:J domain-containing protein n=1 Tax=Caenorhabditis tropicalis TaxID=1561998 RepID=A0A1I7TDG7_9PELO
MSFADILDSKAKEPRLYQILGCDERATTDQITAEYRARVRDFHPDKVSKEESPKNSTDKFMELQNAYSILTSESRRKAYDSWLHSPFPASFEEFTKSQDTFQMSTHWAIPKTQPSIAAKPSEKLPASSKDDFSKKSESRWPETDRYQSSVASAFRNYTL